jgi:hypothetical protein
MPKYAEVIYETGDKSVISFEDEDELKAGLFEQHRRAVNGEPGAAQDYSVRDDLGAAEEAAAHRIATRPAERVKRVIIYDTHPADLVPVGNDGNQPVDAQQAHKLVDAMTRGDGSLNMHQLTQALRDEVSPVYPVDQGRHESMFKMDGSEFDTAFLSAAESGGSNA